MDDGARSQRYLRILFVLLVPAAFFNGFDGELRALLLPQLQHAFHVRLGTIGLANIPIGAGQFVAFLLIRLADRIGRRPLLLISLFGYAAFTGCTATSQSVWMFALFQFFSQVFAGTEYALAVIVVLEEFPRATRGARSAACSSPKRSVSSRQRDSSVQVCSTRPSAGAPST